MEMADAAARRGGSDRQRKDSLNLLAGLTVTFHEVGPFTCVT